MSTTRPLSLVGAPSSAGAYAPGQERAPAAWREHGLPDALRAGGRAVRDRGDLPLRRWGPDRDRPEAMNVEGVAATARAVATEVAAALRDGDDVLVLGGDCTVELGTVAGALGAASSVGLVYVDLDADLKVPATGEGALDWMGVAHLLDAEGAEPELCALGPRRPMLTGADVVLVAQDNITDSEAEIVERHGVGVVTLADVRRDPLAAGGDLVQRVAAHDLWLAHVDIDVLSWVDFPIAENSRRRDGLLLTELEALLGVLLAAPGCRGLTVCEVNPDHAPDETASMTRLVEVLAGVLSPRR